MKIYKQNTKKTNQMSYKSKRKLLNIGFTGKVGRVHEYFYLNGTMLLQKNDSRLIRIFFDYGMSRFLHKDDLNREKTI